MESVFIARILVETEKAKIAAKQALELIFGNSLINIVDERKNSESTGYIAEITATVRGQLPDEEEAKVTNTDLRNLRKEIEKDSVV